MSQDLQRPDAGPAGDFPPDVDGGESVDVLGFVHRHRRGFVAVTAVTGLLAAGGFFASLALPPVGVVATMDLTPTFPGAREGRYPNRAPYSPQDIVANAIVEPVWKSQGLEATVPLAQVCRNLQIVSGGREIDQVRTEFVQKLSNSKLTLAERGALEAEFAARMKAMNAASLAISLSGMDGVMSPEQMLRLLTALPVEWARATDAVGGRAYDYPVPQGKELRASGASAAESAGATGAVVHAERLNGFAESLKRAVDAMMQLPGSSNVRDSQGTSLIDLSQELNSTRRNLLIPAYLGALAQARTLDPGGYDAIRSTRKRLLDSELEAAKERARVLREAFTSYANEAGMAPRDGGVGVDDPNRTGIIANIDGTFIDRVIEQAVKSRNIEYQRELTDRIVTAELDVVERKQQQSFEAWLEQSVLTARMADRSAASATAARLADLTERLAGFADRAQMILATLSARNLNPASAMFRVDMAPTVRFERAIGTREVVFGAAAMWFMGVAMVTLLGVFSDRRRNAVSAMPAVAHDLGALVAGPLGAMADRRPNPRRISAEPREPVS